MTNSFRQRAPGLPARLACIKCTIKSAFLETYFAKVFCLSILMESK